MIESFDSSSAPHVRSRLRELSFGAIRKELSQVEPEEVGSLLAHEPELAFCLDYYLQLFEPEIGERIINHPAFPPEALMDLFSCRIAAYHGLRLGTSEEDFETDLFQGYWQNLKPDRLGQLIQKLLPAGPSAWFPLLQLLGRREPRDLLYLCEQEYLCDAEALRIFRSAGQKVFEFITQNLNLYDYLQRLAVHAGDSEYLELLNGYFNVIVNLRVAEEFIEDCMRLKGHAGRISLQDLVDKVSHIPEESQEYTMHLLETRGMIEAGTLRAVLDLA